MAVTYVKTFTTTCNGALIEDINNDGDISPVLEQISNEGGPGNTTFYFASSLSGPEETALDNKLASWVCPVSDDDSTNVDLTGADVNDTLVWNGSEWVPGKKADLVGSPAAYIPDAQISSSGVTQHEGDVNHNSLLNAHNLTTDIDHDQLTNNHNLTTDIDHDQLTNNHNLTTDIDHNTITNNHNLTTDIDHSTITNGHNLTTDIDHDQLTNTHNLTTDIDHDQLTNTHDLTTDIDHNSITNGHNLTTDIDHNSLTNTHNLTTDIDHDQLTNFSADEHFTKASIQLGDLGNVNLAGSPSPQENDVLVFNGSLWIHGAFPTGAASTTLSVWTQDTSGSPQEVDLYYADFTHNLNTTDVAVYLYDSNTLREVQAECVRITNANTVRVWVRGNTESIKCNVVTGRGPQGPQGPQGSNTIILEEGGGAVTNTPHDTIDFDGTDFDVTDNADGSATVSLASTTKTVVIPHTWAIAGEIKVASGDTDFLVPFSVPVPSGQTVKVTEARYFINSGTNCNVKIQKNGGDLTGFTNITVTTTPASTDPSDQTLADNDRLALVVNTVSGTPKNLSFTLYMEYTF